MRWKISNKLENYDSSIKFMESEILNIANDELDDLIWLLEYPALYTAGLLAKPNDLLNKNKFPVHLSKRGGKYTYHGIFVKKDNGQDYKIASIGCRFKNWISYHGFSINHNPQLEHYSGINPCGLSNKYVTSIDDLGINISKNDLDIAIKENLLKILDI